MIFNLIKSRLIKYVMSIVKTNHYGHVMAQLHLINIRNNTFYLINYNNNDKSNLIYKII